MPPRSSARHIIGVLCALAGLFGAVPAVGQTHDEARLTVGMALGYIGGVSLWTVDRQPIVNPDLSQDLLTLERRLAGSITVSAQTEYFTSPHWGYTGEFTYIGLGTEDSCTLAGGTGGELGGPVCEALKGLTRPASSVSMMGGMVWRPISHTMYQPFVRGLLGVAVVPRSTLHMTSIFGPQQENLVEIYTEDNSHMIRPAGTMGVGITTAPSAGYQLSVEVRETWAVMAVVTGPTIHQELKPPSANRVKMFPSLMVGLNVVLERRRGRRY